MLCTQVLRHDAQSVKARYWRATAYMRLEEGTKAKADLQEARRIDPANREVARCLRECVEEEQRQLQRTKVRRVTCGEELSL